MGNGLMPNGVLITPVRHVKDFDQFLALVDDTTEAAFDKRKLLLAELHTAWKCPALFKVVACYGDFLVKCHIQLLVNLKLKQKTSGMVFRWNGL